MSTGSSSSSSSSSSSPCYQKDGIYYPETGEVDLTACGSKCLCTVPDSIVDGDPEELKQLQAGVVLLPCRPLIHTKTLSEIASRMGFIKVPIVSDARQWRQMEVPLKKSTNQYSTHGWRFIFQFSGGIPGRPTVLFPNTVPKDVENREDLALAAMVILPEPDGPKQYWIPVTEQFRFALLETENWTVVVQRDPIPLLE